MIIYTTYARQFNSHVVKIPTCIDIKDQKSDTKHTSYREISSRMDGQSLHAKIPR